MRMTKRMMQRGGAAAGVLLLALCALQAQAQEASLPARDMSDAELEQRLTFIETRLRALNPAARRWQYGWTGFYAAATAGQTALAIDEDDNDDQTYYGVGAAKTAGALAMMLIKPLPAVTSHDRFESLPAQTREQRLARLELGEDMLRENADRARQRYGWKRHLVGIGANLLGGAAIAVYGEGSDAVTSTLVGIAVSEATIWTEPRRAIDDLEDYRNGFRNAPTSGARDWRIVPMLGGAALHISF
jgi:hypothetical protein